MDQTDAPRQSNVKQKANLLDIRLVRTKIENSRSFHFGGYSK